MTESVLTDPNEVSQGKAQSKPRPKPKPLIIGAVIVVAFRAPILSRELRPAALSSDGRKKSKLLGTFPVYRRL